jgi:hypothetical protein
VTVAQPRSVSLFASDCLDLDQLMAATVIHHEGMTTATPIAPRCTLCGWCDSGIRNSAVLVVVAYMGTRRAPAARGV